ncbi:transposase [Roseobacter fucihabitans]|uniref:transposase n=1 Tax=Roseobacter fucihabitans TaxID=1537242 RepID=UPI0038707F98
MPPDADNPARCHSHRAALRRRFSCGGAQNRKSYCRDPRQLMAWLGLVPSEHSSGNTTRRGRLTKTGNALARTMLVEAGWSYRHPPKEGHPYLKRSAHLPQEIRDIGWKAQTRLCKRYRDLSRTGKPQPRVLAAIARELAGFIWDIARKTPITA